MRAVQMLYYCFFIVCLSCSFLSEVHVGSVSIRDTMNRRGPYFKYLKNVALPIPRSTINSRQNVAEADHNNQNQEFFHVPREIDNLVFAAGEPDEPNENAFIRQDNFELQDDDRSSDGYTTDEGSSGGEERPSHVDDVNEQMFEPMEIDGFAVGEPDQQNENANIQQDNFGQGSDSDSSNSSMDEGDSDDEEPPIAVNDVDNIPDIEQVVARQPLYQGCPITEEEAKLLIMSFAIRHSVKDVLIQDLLELVNCFLPEFALPSMYIFLKQFPIADFDEYFFCRSCENFITFANGATARCSKCNLEFSKQTLKSKGDFFIHIPLKKQFERLLSSPLYHDLDRDGPQKDTLCDVTSGSFHKKIRRTVMTDKDIDIQLNLDGVQLHKSSTSSLCPTQVMLNNLPYKLRKKNILLAGLWNSPGRPIMELYLKPMLDELRDLHVNGFQCSPPGFEEPITVRVHTILAPVDSVERCVLQNIHQYNGLCGCSYCLHPGERIKIGENKYTRVYKGDVHEKRTEQQHATDALAAEQSRRGEVFNGVKGTSPFMYLPLFHIINSFPPDYLHCVLLGVVNLFVSTWLDPTFTLSISNKIRLLNARLLNIRPPSEISRIAQSVANLCRWKGSEFRSFLLYYSLPCLRGILDRRLLEHWSLLVFAITIFNNDEISDEAFCQATIAIRTFVLETEALYGEIIMKFNVHLLLHIPKFVKLFGPLWAWSAFPYESNNSVLRSMVHNSQAVLNQICKAYLRFQNVKYDKTFDGPCNENAKKFYFKMLGKFKKHTGKQVFANDRLFVYGKGKVVTLNVIEKVEIERLLNEEICEVSTCYERFVCQRMLCHSNTYSRIIRRKNSVVEIDQEQFIDVNGIYRVCTKNNNTTKYVVLGKLFRLLDNDNLCSYGAISTSKYCIPVTETENIRACWPRDVKTKAILISSENRHISFVVKLVNKVETD